MAISLANFFTDFPSERMVGLSEEPLEPADPASPPPPPTLRASTPVAASDCVVTVVPCRETVTAPPSPPVPPLVPALMVSEEAAPVAPVPGTCPPPTFATVLSDGRPNW